MKVKLVWLISLIFNCLSNVAYTFVWDPLALIVLNQIKLKGKKEDNEKAKLKKPENVDLVAHCLLIVASYAFRSTPQKER